MSVIGASGTHQGVLHLYKNGSLVTGVGIGTEVASTDEQSASLCTILSLSSGDYLELWIENEDSNDNFTVGRGQLCLS